MQDIQQRHHASGYDYAKGSPHLKHAVLRDWLTGYLRSEVALLSSVLGRQPSVLEVGAGHGTFTNELLSAGAAVVVTEMSEPSAAYLEQQFEAEPNVQVYLSRDGEPPGQVFDMAVYLSVLHHIPDYIEQLESVSQNNLAPTASLVSFQDPTWYPRMPLTHRAIAQACFVPWRLTQGDLRQGAGSMYRRLTKSHDASLVSDMSEYHVVRQGVDEEAIRGSLDRSFSDVHVLKYWSTQSELMQNLGWGRFPPNTFGIIARRS